MIVEARLKSPLRNSMGGMIERCTRPALSIGALIIAKEEDPIALNRTAKCETRAEDLGRRFGVSEEVRGDGGVGVAANEHASFELVGAGFERDCCDGAAGAAEFSVIVARRHAHGFDGICVGINTVRRPVL